MSTDPLATRLRALRDDLSGLSTLDPESRALAGGVAAELERLGASSSGARANAPTLEALAVRFEADHPALAAALRQGADLLAKAGI